MSPEFYSEYLRIQTRRRKASKAPSFSAVSTLPTVSIYLSQLLYVMNPMKFRACQVRTGSHFALSLYLLILLARYFRQIFELIILSLMTLIFYAES